jgi:hypothetical protein
LIALVNWEWNMDSLNWDRVVRSASEAFAMG